MEAFLPEEEKFLVADASRSSERRNPTTPSDMGVGKPAVGERFCDWTRRFGEIPLKFSGFQNAACALL